MEDLLREDKIDQYLQEVGSHRILTREEEVELFQRIEQGDEQARDEVVRCNLRLVIRIALQFRGAGLPIGDLIQEGNVGLLYVTRKFDWRKGFRFSTYAAFWIRQEIQAAVRSNGSLIRLPIRKARMMGRIAEAIRHFSLYEGRDPSVDEIAELVGLDADKVAALLPLRESIVSLDADRNDDGGSLLDTIAEDRPAPFERLDEEQTADTVRAVLDFLTEREREVIEWRFGLRTGKPMSLRKTSRKVGLSQEGVRRIERRALGKLQRPAIRSRLDGLIAA